jgi:hypothetical protein
MAERQNRLNRLADLCRNGDLSQALDEAYRHTEMGIELLPALVEDPTSVKLEHSIRIIEIATDIVPRNPAVAITAIRSQLQAFGQYVKETRIMAGPSVGVDVAREERMEKAAGFAAAWLRAQIALQELITRKTPQGKEAAALIAEWSHVQ